MAKFTAVPGLEEMVAQMVAPGVERIAQQVETEAKRFAPPTKKWITVGDERVRPTHAEAHGQVVPDNLRFVVTSMEWDRQHRGVGANTYFRWPKDETSRAVANLVHCRCARQVDKEGIARLIHTSKPVITGKKVTATVVCQGDWVVQSEYGTVYPGQLVATGAHFMARAAAAVAARR